MTSSELPSPSQLDEWNEYLQDKTPQEIMKWALKHFAQQEQQLATSTSFGMHSAVMLHLLWKGLQESESKMKVPVLWIDTGYLPPETYHFAKELKERFPLDFRTYQSEMTPAHMEAIHGRLWEDESSKAHEMYGYIRKVEPMERALNELQATAVFAGLRAAQTDHRKTLKIVNINRGRLKICPILNWTDADVDEYMKVNNLPYHPLKAKGYVTVGDAHSSRPVQEGDISGRDTRFNGKSQECGLHVEDAAPIISTDEIGGPLNTPEEYEKHPNIITIFSKPTCRFCRAAKTLLSWQSNSSQWIVKDFTVGVDVDYGALQQRVGNRAQVRTVPQIFVNEEYIGGYTDIAEWFKLRDNFPREAIRSAEAIANTTTVA